MRILGIHLGANENEGSGIAQMEDFKVRTYSVYKDKEIFEMIERFKPAVICINGPLYLSNSPFRSAEKEMVAVGYNPDPQNMSNRKELAKRGNNIRVEYKKDFEIIECHSESAKKSLGISDINDLNNIRALNIIKNRIEKEAVFAAVSGLFYKEGMFQEFGDDEEGKIIVPKMN